MNARQSVLFVDDDREFRKAMRKVFERSGYGFTEASDGMEALDLLSQDRFDLIVSDLRMPNLDGMRLMEELNRKELDVPVIFITAYGDVESYMSLMNMGAFDYLNKPVGTKEILGVVRSALDTQRTPLHSTSR